jgi:polyhydroxybutyrate depolymerase
MAQLKKNEKPSRPISLLMINGSADKAFPWNGGNTSIVRIRVGEVAPILTTYNYWVNANDGADIDIKKKEESLQKRAGGTKVEFINTQTENGACILLYKINGGGHTWPGSEVPLRYIPLLGRQSRQMNASELIWEFFKNNKDDCQT